jgi:hypothetical protein
MLFTEHGIRVKVIPLHTKQAYRGGAGMALSILDSAAKIG